MLTSAGLRDAHVAHGNGGRPAARPSALRVPGRCGPYELHAGAMFAAQLCADARELLAAADLPVVGVRAPTGTLEALATRLARPGGPAAPSTTGPEPSWARFAAEVARAGDVVFDCRHVAHPAGTCWFGPRTESRCADVLAAAHALARG